MYKILTTAILCASLFAEDFYLAPSPVGGATGANCANALDDSFFNNAANWGVGAGKISPADNCYLCSGGYSSVLTFQGNGTAGNLVTLKFMSGAEMTNACWPSTGAIELNGKNYIAVDGQGVGKIYNTANGTGKAQTNNSRGVYGANCETVLITNLTVSQIFHRTNPPQGPSDQNRLGYPIQCDACNNFNVGSNTVSDGDALISMIGASDTTNYNFFFIGNTLTNSNHHFNIRVGDANSTVSNLVARGNYLDHWDAWTDTNQPSSLHSDGFIIYNNSFALSSVLTDVLIEQNLFGPYVGVNTTAAIFNNMQNACQQTFNFKVINNRFACTNIDILVGTNYLHYGWNNGFVTTCGSNVLVANNTLFGVITTSTNYIGGPPVTVNYGGDLRVSGTNAFRYNNLSYTGSGGTMENATPNNETGRTSSGPDTEYILTNYFTKTWADYNVIVGNAVTFTLALYKTNNADNWPNKPLFTELYNWQTWYDNNRGMTVPIWNTTHADPHSTTNIPTFVGSSFLIPAANDTIAKGKGTNLFAWGVTNDFNGTARSSSGNFTIGAINVEAASSSTNLGGGIIKGRTILKGIIK